MTDTPDRLLAALALRQHGNVTRRQLLSIGLDDRAIGHRVKIGRLIRVYTGVYAVGHAPTNALSRAAAAVLACGRGALLSHDSALSLWGWRMDWRTPFDVTAPSYHRRAGIRIHRSSCLTRTDARVQLGIRVTNPVRTILDVAPECHRRGTLTRLINDARHSGHLQLQALAEMLTRFPRHPGAKLLIPFVEAPDGLTRSDLEDAFIAFTDTFNLPRPKTNVYVGGYLVDAWFEAERVVVELDSYGFHWTKHSFESDRDRDADLLDRLNIETVRITWARLTGKSAREAARLQRILSRRRG